MSRGLLDRFGVSPPYSGELPATGRKGGGMRVSVENVPQVDLGNKGILIRIRDEQGDNIGKLWIGQANIRWAKGSIPEQNAKKLSIQKFVNFLNNL